MPSPTIKRMSVVLAASLWLTMAHASPVLPLPASVQDGQTVLLSCGRIYSGTLDLRGRRDVTVRTEGRCGRAAITPAQPVSGWKQQGKIWSAALDRAPAMLQLGADFVALAHHPNSAETWMTGEGRGEHHLKVSAVDHDLTGAIVNWQAEDWLILRQTVASDDHGLLRISASPEPGFGFPQQTRFYLEGQRWMLDTPGEWIHENGRLYLWPVDGRSPEGRVWAAQKATAIDARGSRGLKIQDLSIFLAARGIDGSDAQALSITDTQIHNSGEEAMLIGGDAARVARVRIVGSQQHGIRAEDSATDVSITDSVIEDAGMLGMPQRSKGAIVFEQASGQFIARNRITRSAYIGIRVYRNATVEDNQISRACQRMTDCGGIYTFARDRQPLQSRIARNRISGLRGKLSQAIYLDDYANGVVVSDNQMKDNSFGMQLHNAFGNLIRGNRFARSAQAHLLFNETAPFAAISGNQISGNRFIATDDVPVYRLWSHHGGVHLSRFADFSGNRYEGSLRRFAQLEQAGWLDHQQWAQRMHETEPVFSGPRTFPQLARQPQKK